MRIAKQNNPTNIDSLFDTGVEPADKKDRRIHKAVPDSFDFVANDCSDVTLALDINELPKYLRSLDHVCKQLLIAYAFANKAGATDVDKWNNCSNAEKDTILYYNQFKGLPGGAEDVAKVTYLITSGKASDAAEAATWLRANHSDSIVRTRPSVRDRVEGSRVVQAIIKYLTPHDTQQLLDTMSAYLTGYKDYLLIGTVIPGNQPGVYDYINSTDIYTGDGLVEEGWITQTGTLADLRDALNDILFGDNEIVL